MSEQKTYTAQELREAADFFVRNAEMVRQKVLSNAILANIHDLIPMLRQAAEMQERCEAEIAKLPYPPNADDVYMFKRLNYILRGDAGKEEK